MRARHWLLIALAACSAPSRLDLDSKPADKDPWSHPKRDKDKDDGLGGLDLQSIVAKIKDSIEKPGPYEAAEKSADYSADKPHWGVVKLGGAVVEREAFSFTGGRGIELRTAIDRLRELAKEPNLTGIVLRVDALEISYPDLVELRAAMHDVRAAAKKLYCHAEDASNATYLVLAACERIGLAPLGQIAITGPAAMPVHLKGLLDKLGVQADFVHIGAYKSAAEPLTNDAPSKQMVETLDAILDRRYDTMVDIIAKDRNLDPAAVKGLIDTALFRPDEAKAQKLVDDIASFEAFRDELKAPWAKLKLEHDHDNQLQAMMKLGRFVGWMPPDRPAGPHVAVVYALGNIVDGNGEGVLGARGEIASHTMVAALHALGADDAVKAIVLRIDSGGGSAQASELIWRAVADVKAKKPVIVSMSDVAASGGYYIASGATKIFALDDTLTGSIGVVGGKIAPANALANVGIKTYPMGRGKHATMMARLSPWSTDEKNVIETSMRSVYGVFVGRVAEGRHKTADDIQKIAEGRVWTGAKAKELGLVDEIGGLDAALAEARKLGSVDAATDLEVYPPAPTLRDVLVGYGQVQAPLGVTVLAALREADPALADAAQRLLELALSFRATTIQTVAILPEIR
jgi:protease-4